MLVTPAHYTTGNCLGMGRMSLKLHVKQRSLTNREFLKERTAKTHSNNAEQSYTCITFAQVALTFVSDISSEKQTYSYVLTTLRHSSSPSPSKHFHHNPLSNQNL